MPGALDIEAVAVTQPLDSELNSCSIRMCITFKLICHRCFVPIDESMGSENWVFLEANLKETDIVIPHSALFNAVLFIGDKKTKA